MSLHDEGRGGDVGEQHALGETHLQDVGHVAAVAEHGAETAENVAPGYGAAAFGRERLAEAETTCEQDASQHQQDAEDALPADRVGEGAADDGGDDRSHAVDGADQRQHPGQVAASEPVGGDRPRNDNAARTGDALQETRSDELADVRGEDAEQGGADEEPHGRQQRRSASVFVAQGTEEQLSGSQADHAGGESHLHHRRGGMEEIRHGGQRRQVHIRYERTECCQQAQQDEQVNFDLLVKTGAETPQKQENATL